MSVEQEFVRLKEKAITTIRELALEHFQRKLIESLRPAIAITATVVDDAKIPLGASKFGGSPDLPANLEWPVELGKPLGFLAQINLQDVAPFDIERQLPPDGILAFFYRYYGDQHDLGYHRGRVLWFPSEGIKRKQIPQGVGSRDCYPIPACSLEFSPEWMAREFHHSELEGVWDFNDYFDVFLPALGRTRNAHRIGGYPKMVQDPLFLTAECERVGLDYRENQAEIDAESDNWRLLLQLDSQRDLELLRDDWLFGDAGTIFFAMRKEDLSARRFERMFCCYEGC